MQLTIRIDDANTLTFNVQLQIANPDRPQDGTEVVSATIADENLSHIETDDLLDITQQVLDFLTPSDNTSIDPDEDWRIAFRKGH